MCIRDRSRNVRTGSIEGPLWCKIITLAVIWRLYPKWSHLGIHCGGYRYQHAVWADNWYLFAHQRSELSQLLRLLTSELRNAGLRWKESSLEYTNCQGIPERTIVLQGGLLVKWRSTMLSLGEILHHRGLTLPAVNHRLAKAQASFEILSDCLLYTSPSPRDRG